MASSRTSSSRRPIKKGGMFIPALCNVSGTLILIAVIAITVPIAVPRLMGYESYYIETGSMEPTLPVGCVVYAESVDPRSVETDDIIVYYSHGTVVTHRVVINQYFYEEFVTKGDANEKEDVNPVPYSELIGRVKYHIPYIGPIMMVAASDLGKIYLMVLAFCGVMFNILAGQMRRRAEEKFREEVERWERRQVARNRAEIAQIRKQGR